MSRDLLFISIIISFRLSSSNYVCSVMKFKSVSVGGSRLLRSSMFWNLGCLLLTSMSF